MLLFQWFKGDQNPHFNDALTIRTKVFVEEQLVDASLEIDGEDAFKHHVVAYDGEVPVATARVYFLPNQTHLKVQRVAVLKSRRGQHIGAQLMHEVEAWAQQNGATHLVLSAQDTATAFYEKNGFKIINPIGYMDAGIPHHDMGKSIVTI